MPALFGNIGTVVNMAQAINGGALGNPVYASQLQAVDASGTSSLIASYNSQLASSASATLATTVLNNLFVTTAAGVPAANVTALTTALAQAFDAYPTAKGQVISNLSSLLGNLESDANWGPAARAFNSQAAANYTYSINTANSASGTPSSSSTSTYTLTTGSDTASGSSITGFAATGTTAGDTFNPGDTIRGTSGTTDTLNLTVTGTIAANPLITDFEILNVRAAATGVMSGAGGFTTISSKDSTATMSITGITKAATLGFENYGATNGTDARFTYGSDVLGSTSASQTFNVNKVGTQASNAVVRIDTAGSDQIKTLNIAATNANFITHDATDNNQNAFNTVTTLNVTGTGSLRIGGQAATLDNVTTVTASNSGGLNLDLATGGNAKNVTFTGGAGNDRVSVSATNFTVDDKFAFGEGTDTLAIADQTVTTAGNATLITAIKAVTGLEILELTGTTNTGNSLSMSNVGLSQYLVSGAMTGANGAANATGTVALTITGQGSQTLQITGSQTGGNATVAGAGSNVNGKVGAVAVSIAPTTDNGSNAITITLGDTAGAGSGVTLTGGAGSDKEGNGTTSGNGADALSIASYETINILSQGAANTLVGGSTGGTNGTSAAGAGLAVSTNATINVTGSQDLTLGPISGSNATIAAANFTGKLSAAVTAGNSVINSGSAADTITLAGTGVQATVNLGAGNDTINVLGSTAFVTKTNTAAAAAGTTTVIAGAAGHGDSITLGAGADTIKFIAADIVDTLKASAGTTRVTKINDFTAGQDKIAIVDLGGAATSMVLATAQTVATAASLTEVYAAITAISASTDGGALSGVVVTVSAGVSAGTYLYINDAAGAGVSNANDMLINITGISGTLTATDFLFA